MKNLSRTAGKKLLIGLGLLFLVCFMWNRFYYAGPTAAYYELASAFEAQDTQRLKQLIRPDDYTQKDLDEMVKPYGGMRNFGKQMRQSPNVDVAIHMLFTVDVFATMQGRPMMIQFSWNPAFGRPGGWGVTVINTRW